MKRAIVLLLVIVLSLCLSLPAMAASTDDQTDTTVTEYTADQTDSTVTEYTAYETEVLNVLGNIWGILLFFTVVVLFYFAYKFLRIFF